jgi:wyosine [tRNA(Phe)-imidazoG37] synthetase (radical SAM superfamily)
MNNALAYKRLRMSPSLGSDILTGIKTNDQAVFGPVPSRRLGFSLGVDLLHLKTCTLDCIYCELGPTSNKTTQRERFRDATEVLAEVEQRLAELDYPPDYITLAGSGEPTLHQDMGLVLGELKKISPAKLAVLTNGTLCTDPAVRADLAQADVVVPSLDAVSQAVFEKINRPAPGLAISDIIKGLEELRHEFSGQLWLEVLLVEGINDSPQEIKGIVEAAGLIKPEKVQLNTVVRPPAYPGARALSHERLSEIAGLFKSPAEVIAPPKGKAGTDRGSRERQVVEMTRRRPLTLKDVAAAFGLEQGQAKELLDGLMARGMMKEERFGDRIFFRGT